jgi:hypothetical protein
MKNDAAWCRAMASTLLRSAETRRGDHEVYTAMRGLAFDCQAVALLIEAADDMFLAEATTAPGRIATRVGVAPSKDD